LKIGQPLKFTSLRIAKRMAETCGRNAVFIISVTCIHSCAFFGFSLKVKVKFTLEQATKAQRGK
jgi:hypothetical protein